MGVEEIEASKDAILGKCDFFTDVHLWPLTNELDARQWLSNFTEEELPFALRMLDGFLFFSRVLVDAMFVSGFQNISSHVAKPGAMPLAVQSAWSRFCSDVVITHVEGEIPRPTDSGYGFARRARQLLSIPEDQIVTPDEALAIAIRAPHRPIVFVDDFVGSGQQFEQSWTRDRVVPGSGTHSFASASLNALASFVYCPILCTRAGAKHIRDYCPRAKVLPVHYLDSSRDSVLGPGSGFWIGAEHSLAFAAIKGASLRAGIPETGKDRWDGYEGLGLAVAFEHSVPDATLPIFYWELNGWKPLLQRK